MDKLTEIEIIESVIKGNEADYELLINLHKNKTFTLLKRILKNEQDAEEVLQDVFLKVYYKLSTFKGESKFSTWLYKIAYNTALTKLASKKRKIEIEMSSIEKHFDLKELDNKHYSETNSAESYLFKILEEMPIRYAVIINLFYIDNLSVKEISEVINTSIVNVKVMLHRARNILRDLLVKHNYQEELL